MGRGGKPHPAMDLFARYSHPSFLVCTSFFSLARFVSARVLGSCFASGSFHARFLLSFAKRQCDHTYVEFPRLSGIQNPRRVYFNIRDNFTKRHCLSNGIHEISENLGRREFFSVARLSFHHCKYPSVFIDQSVYESFTVEFPTVGEFKFTFYCAWIVEQIGGKFF